MPNLSGLKEEDFDNISIQGVDVTTSVFSTTKNGLVPASGTSNTTDFLRRDGTFATVPSPDVGDGGLTEKNFTTDLKNKLDGIEASADITDTINVTAAGALMDTELTDLTGIKALDTSTLQVKPSEGAFANGDKTKLDGIPSPTASDSTKVITVNSGGNYELGTGASSTYDTTFTSGTLEAVGGIPVNTPYTDLVGQSITTILDMMLYPVQYPTIKQPNANISLTNSGLKTIGDTLNHNVKFTFSSNDNKVITVDGTGNVFTYSGVIKEAYHDSFGSGTDTAFLGSGEDGAFTSHTDIEQQTISNRLVTEGVSTMTVKIKWENGTYQPLDSAGNNFSTTYATATDFLTKTSSVTGVYPRFLGNSSGTYNQMTLKSHTENNQEFNQDYTETEDERHRFQISKSQYDAKSWEMEFFSTATGQYEDLIGGFSISNIDKSIESVDVSYIQFTRLGDEGGSTKYRLKYT